MGASEAKLGGTEIGNGWGSQRRRWGKVGLFGEELVGMALLSRRQEAGGQRLELDLELGLAEMEEVGVSSSAGQQGKRCCWPQ